MKFFLTIISFNFSILGYGQKLLLKNEARIFSFKTGNGKQVIIAKDTGNRYIIYRFGTPSKIELAYPKKLNESWTNFNYSGWLRGGGKENEGIDLNHLFFDNNNFRYVIYQTYFGNDKKYRLGIKIINLKTNKILNINGRANTQNGTLIDFRDNHLIHHSDMLFD